jgi:hypothetical protein
MTRQVKVHAPELWEPKPYWLTSERAAFLRSHAGVDPALLAEELGVKESTIRLWQRKLGLRKCLNAQRKAERLAEVTA